MWRPNRSLPVTGTGKRSSHTMNKKLSSSVEPLALAVLRDANEPLTAEQLLVGLPP